MAGRLASLACIAVVAALASCAPLPPKPAPGPSAADIAFRALADRYLDDNAALYPVEASLLGDHRHDGALDELGSAAREQRAALARRYLAEIAALDRSSLARANQVDARLLTRHLEWQLWDLTELEELRWNPLRYVELAGDAIHSLMARDYAPLAGRLRAATLRLEALPRLLAEEREALDPARVPRVYADAAVRQSPGIALLIAETVAAQAGALEGEERERLERAVATAKTTLSQHQIWLTRRLLPAASGEPRLGAARFDRALQFALDSPLPRAEIRARAQAAMQATRAEMYGIAREVLRARPGAPALPEAPSPEAQQQAIAAALELAYAERPAREDLLAHARQALGDVRGFLTAADLVTLYDDPVEVIAMPLYRRGEAAAYCDAPGPAGQGQPSFYAIAPVPTEWPAATAQSFLREYNDRALRLQALEVALPGRCLQAMHASRAGDGGPASAALRALVASQSFADGWALYAAHLAIEQGYGDHDPLLRLLERKRYLRAVADALLDQGVHVDGLSREDAMQLLTRDAFQEEREASANWIRAELGPARLTGGFVGAAALEALRAEAAQRAGSAFSLHRYHDAALSFGAPPVRYLRALLFELTVED